MNSNDCTSSHDKKIMSWDKKDYDSFISSFTDSELAEMTWYLENHPLHPIEVELESGCFDAVAGIVYDYVIHWLYEQLNDGTVSGTKELCEVALALM